jgi:hypothetical protein
VAVQRAFPGRFAPPEDLYVDTRKISRPPSAPASPRFNAREDGAEDADELAEGLDYARLHESDDEPRPAKGA